MSTPTQELYEQFSKTHGPPRPIAPPKRRVGRPTLAEQKEAEQDRLYQEEIQQILAENRREMEESKKRRLEQRLKNKKYFSDTFKAWDYSKTIGIDVPEMQHRIDIGEFVIGSPPKSVEEEEEIEREIEPEEIEIEARKVKKDIKAIKAKKVKKTDLKSRRYEIYEKIKIFKSENADVLKEQSIKSTNKKGSSYDYYLKLYQDMVKEVRETRAFVEQLNLKNNKNYQTEEILTEVEKINKMIAHGVDYQQVSLNLSGKPESFTNSVFNGINFPTGERGDLLLLSIRSVVGVDDNGNEITSTTYITANPLFLGELTNYLQGDTQFSEEQYQPVFEAIKHAINIDFELISVDKYRNIKNKKNGKYFLYKHKTNLDLTPLQIYRVDEEGDSGTVNCLINCFKYFKFDVNAFIKVSKYVINGGVSKCKLKDIAKELNITIELKTIRMETKNNFRVETINKGCEKVIKLGLIENHFFPDIEIECSPFAIKNYSEIKDFENWNLIIKRRNNGFRRSKKASISSPVLVRLFLENKDNLLEKISNTELQKKSIKDYNSDNIIPENSRVEEVTYKEKISQNLETFTFDTEASVNGLHKVYLASLTKYDNDKIIGTKSTSGENCVINLFRKLPKNKTINVKKEVINIENGKKEMKTVKKSIPYLIYVQNLKYDNSFLKEHTFKIKNMIINNGKEMQIEGWIAGRLIIFRNSLNMILETPLSKYGKIFELEQTKDVCPYGVYTTETIKQRYVRISSARDYFEKRNEMGKYAQFMENCEKLQLFSRNGRQFDHIKYSKYYCEKDTEVLALGLIKFRKWMREITELDIQDFISLPSLVHHYFIKEGCYAGCYQLTGITRDYIQKCVVGGRCQLAFNRPQKIEIDFDNTKATEEELIQDFDACSLYPSGMKRLAEIGGYLLGKPKILESNQLNYEFLSKQDGYFIRINLKRMGKKRAFPVISKVYNNKRNWENDITGEVFIDKLTLEDLMKFHKITEADFEIIDGYYFNSGRENKIGEIIQKLYDIRKQKKKEGNAIQFVYKLLMNSAYGKTILKPIKYDYKQLDSRDEFERLLLTDHNKVAEATKITGTDKWIVKLSKSTEKHKSIPHVGVEILSMSKRIMNEIQCLAEDKKCKIYYQDTDSVHISNKDIKILENAFEKKYNRKLIGKEMGQFHSDFEKYKDPETGKEYNSIGANLSILCSKKLYTDNVLYRVNGKIISKTHFRMKGISSEVVEYKAKQENKKIVELYDKLYNYESIEFDLAKCPVKPSFGFTKDGRVFTRDHFKRKISII